MTAYTVRVIAVVRANTRLAANLAARQDDVDPRGGDKTWTVALKQAGDATNVVRAYWCGWSLTPAQAQAIRDRLKAAGLTDDEVRIVPPAEKASFAPSATAKAYIFNARDGDGWTPAEVLANLGLAIVPMTPII